MATMEEPKPTRTWVTQLTAIDPQTEELRVWPGPNISAPSLREAEMTLAENGLGYYVVIGELIATINEDESIETPDNGEWWSNPYP